MPRICGMWILQHAPDSITTFSFLVSFGLAWAGHLTLKSDGYFGNWYYVSPLRQLRPYPYLQESCHVDGAPSEGRRTAALG